MSFHDLGLSEPILRSLTEEGYQTPSPIQAKAIPAALEGKDLLGCAQTGTGKTAAFALPILHRLTSAGNPPKGQGRRIRVLVLAPTRELACQIADSFLRYGKNTPLRVVAIFGGVNQAMQVRALRNGIDILIATPGRLVDLMNQGYVDLRSVQALVLDEADRMFDMGFAPDLKRVMAVLPPERQNLLFSATMPGPIEELARAILKDPVRVEIAPVQATTDLIDQSVVHLPRTVKAQVLSAYLQSTHLQRAIVFTKTKHGADRVARALHRKGFSTEAIHGDKRQNVRQRILHEFRSDKIKVLVATDIAARGIDVDGISHVINYDLPMDPETYTHRIGRTGRAGARGIALTLCSPEEKRLLRSIEQFNKSKIPLSDLEVEGALALEPNGESRDAHWEESLNENPRRVPPHRKFRPQKVRGKRDLPEGVQGFGNRKVRKTPEFGGSRGSEGTGVWTSEDFSSQGGTASATKAPVRGGPQKFRPYGGERIARGDAPESEAPRFRGRGPGRGPTGGPGEKPRVFRKSRLPGKGGTRGPRAPR